MAVQAHRSSWSDERLDDLNQTVREGFARTDSDIRGFRDESHLRFSQIDSKFDSLHRTLLLGMIGLIGTTVASALATIIALT